MDEADRADREAEQHLQRSLANQKADRREALPATGVCHWCKETVEDQQRFCPGGECREDYEQYKRRHGRAPR